MTHQQLIEQLKAKTKLSAKKVEQLLNACVQTLEKELNDGFAVNIKGLGAFEPVEKPEKKVFNPMTKKYTFVPKKKTVKFKPSSTLKNAFKSE